MGLIKRFQNAAAAFRRPPPPPARNQKQRGTALARVPPHLQNADWRISGYPSIVAEGFDENVIIYASIMYKARSLTSAPLRAFTGDPESPDRLSPDHPLARLVARPNRLQSWLEFQSLATVSLNLAGNCYIKMNRPKPGALPESMIILRPDRVNIIVGDNDVMGYAYIPPGQTKQNAIPIVFEDMMHIKLPNPGDPLTGLGVGLSPVVPIAKSTDVDNEITNFLKVFFEHGAMPPVILSFDDRSVDPDEAAMARDEYLKLFGGTDSWIEPMVMGDDVEVIQLRQDFENLGFENIDARNESRLLMPFGVPSILLGTRQSLAGSVSKANYETALRQFWQDTFLPELELFEAEYKWWLHTDDGAFVQFDLKNVVALQTAAIERIDSAIALSARGVPLNEALNLVGVKADLTGGDVIYTPAKSAVAGEGEDEEIDGVSDSDTPEEDIDEGEDGEQARTPDTEDLRLLTVADLMTPTRRMKSWQTELDLTTEEGVIHVRTIVEDDDGHLTPGEVVLPIGQFGFNPDGDGDPRALYTSKNLEKVLELITLRIDLEYRNALDDSRMAAWGNAAIELSGVSKAADIDTVFPYLYEGALFNILSSAPTRDAAKKLVNQYLSRPDLDTKSQATYRRAIRGAVRGLWNGDIELVTFFEQMHAAITRGISQAFVEGAAKAGIAEDELTKEERNEMQRQINFQLLFLNGFAEFVQNNTKERGGKLETVFNRAELWANRYGEIVDLAATVVGADAKYLWNIGPTEVSCRSCKGFDGRVYRGSVWASNNALPRRRSLACNRNPLDGIMRKGYRCLCSLTKTDQRITPGKFPASLLN